MNEATIVDTCRVYKVSNTFSRAETVYTVCLYDTLERYSDMLRQHKHLTVGWLIYRGRYVITFAKLAMKRDFNQVNIFPTPLRGNRVVNIPFFLLVSGMKIPRFHTSFFSYVQFLLNIHFIWAETMSQCVLQFLCYLILLLMIVRYTSEQNAYVGFVLALILALLMR